MDIPIIGLGLLGTAITERLVACGHTVHGYDLRPEACQAAQTLGARTYATAADAASHSPWVLLCLLNSDDRRALLWGEQELAKALRPGTLLLDTTTGNPSHTVEDYLRLEAAGIELVDVCIAGSSAEVRAHQALALAGASREGASAWHPLLEDLARAVFYFGEPGNGNRAKLIFNTVLGLNRLVLAEALGLARKSGFDLGEMLAVLKAGSAYSAVMDTKGPRMVTGSYENPAARLDQHAKDVDLILDLARLVGADTPLSGLHRTLLAELEADGAGPLDNAAIFKRFS